MTRNVARKVRRSWTSGTSVPRWLVGLAAVAVLAAAWFGWSWISAASDESLQVARARDAVVEDISKALVTLHTIDHRSAEDDFDSWVAVTAGRLGEDLQKDRKMHLDRAAGTKTVSTAEVRRLAVSELDVRKGTARVLAVLDVRLSTGGEPPKPNRRPLTVIAQRTDDGWKVAEVQVART